MRRMRKSIQEALKPKPNPQRRNIQQFITTWCAHSQILRRNMATWRICRIFAIWIMWCLKPCRCHFIGRKRARPEMHIVILKWSQGHRLCQLGRVMAWIRRIRLNNRKIKKEWFSENHSFCLQLKKQQLPLPAVAFSDANFIRESLGWFHFRLVLRKDQGCEAFEFVRQQYGRWLLREWGMLLYFLQ